MNSQMNFASNLKAQRIPYSINAPWQWHVKNRLRWGYLFGRAANSLSKAFSGLTGIPTLTGQLSVILKQNNGQVVDFGVVGYRVITTVFVNEMVDQLQTEDSTWGDFKFHDSGVGTTAAAIGDTDIETTDAESRATGTQTEGASANIYRSVGTISYTTTKAITEHGLFNASTSGELMDRHVFSAINVVNGDSIEFTYELTVNSGG